MVPDAIRGVPRPWQNFAKIQQNQWDQTSAINVVLCDRRDLRVGISFHDSAGGKATKEALIKDCLRGAAGTGPVWLDDRLVEAARSAGLELENLRPADAASQLEPHRPPARIEQLVEHAVAVVGGLVELDDEQNRKMRHRMRNDAAILNLIK